MSFRDRIHDLQTPGDVDRLLDEHPVVVLFKAGGCHKTMQGFGYVEQLLAARDVPVGVMRILEGGRPASDHVAQKLRIHHESPQFILVRDGAVVGDFDNWEITPENLARTEPYLPPPSEEAAGPAGAAVADPGELDPYMQRYLTLLDGYLSGAIPSDAFRAHWLMAVREDSTLRERELFDTLDSLFGNVDGHIHGELPPVPEDTLRQRAAHAFATLVARIEPKAG